MACKLDLYKNHGYRNISSFPPAEGAVTYSVLSLKACGLLSPTLTRLLITLSSCVVVLSDSA